MLFLLQMGGCYRHLRAEARDDAQRPAAHRMATTGNYLAPNVDRAEAVNSAVKKPDSSCCVRHRARPASVGRAQMGLEEAETEKTQQSRSLTPLAESGALRVGCDGLHPPGPLLRSGSPEPSTVALRTRVPAPCSALRNGVQKKAGLCFWFISLKLGDRNHITDGRQGPLWFTAPHPLHPRLTGGTFWNLLEAALPPSSSPPRFTHTPRSHTTLYKLLTWSSWGAP